jgi:membrane-associated phospholipid phosphatase
VNAAQNRRPYFFEIFTVANFIALCLVLPRIAPTAVYTLGIIMPSVAGGFLLQGLVGMAIRLAVAHRHGTARELLDTYRSWGWIVDTVRLAVFSGLWLHTYGWIKLAIPVLHPRLFDQQLWNVDRAICFGYSPNVFLLTIFSSPPLLRVIDTTYADLFFISLTIVGIFFASAPERRLRVAFMNSNTLLWLIGAWLYVALPALGPAYRFPEVWLPLAPLLGRTQHFQRLLMSNYNAVLSSLRGLPRPINILYGVAAFPSLHVAFQTLAFLWMRRLTKWGGTLFGIFALFIFIGSIVTGWHYLVDGIAGALLAWGCYIAACRVPAIRA